MKNKLQEKLIAILLVFAMVFLTVPIVKADMIISLEENEISSGLVSAGESLIIRTANDFSYWYSSNTVFGIWDNMPIVYYNYLDGPENFYTGMSYAVNSWSDALGMSINLRETDLEESLNPLLIFGGTQDEVYGTGEFPFSQVYNSGAIGATIYKSESFFANAYYNGTTYYGYKLNKVRVYVLDLNTLSNYYNTCTHELGHALGWNGHSSNSSDVMCKTNSSDISLSNRDILHIKQMYDIWY